MLVKIFIIVILLFIVGNLFTALYYLMKGDSGERTIKSLTWRIGLSIALFLLLMLGFFTGVLGPPNPHP